VTLIVQATNVDKQRSGDLVLLAFVSPSQGTIPSSEPAANIKQNLFGFERLGSIEPGSSSSAVFTIGLDEIAQFDTNGNPIVYDGTYNMVVRDGSGTENGMVEATITCFKDHGCKLSGGLM